MDNSYFYKDMFGFRFITVDTNFWYDDDGTLYHYPGRGVGSPKGWDYDDNAFGKEQLEWIAKTIDESPYPCILLGHTPVDLSDKPDHKEFLKIIKAANEKNRGRVLTYFSGDKHRNHIMVNGVLRNTTFSRKNLPKVMQWRQIAPYLKTRFRQ